MAAETTEINKYIKVVDELVKINENYHHTFQHKVEAQCDLEKRYCDLEKRYCDLDKRYCDLDKRYHDLIVDHQQKVVEINNLEKEFFKKDFILTEQYKSHNFYRYINVIRNEIAKFDQYAWDSGFKYKGKINLKNNDYHNKQRNKRMLRILHALNNSTEQEVIKLRTKIPDIESFASNVAKVYYLISQDIHKLSYTVDFSQRYCPKIFSEMSINESISLLMENVEFKIGEMV